ncbi:MAG: helix-turn-helix domain-containing protein [Candidatus Eremiobacteraeota bacterium]|nr:helix-turn-helix domain-containing protein [Candidatus Eremiobacteraeota bacterium]
MDKLRVDVRGLPTWERTAVVVAAFHDLPDDAGLTIVTENEPRGLAVSLASALDSQVTFEQRRVGTAEWHIVLGRAKATNGVASIESVLKRSVTFRDLPDAPLATLARTSTVQTAQRAATIVHDNTEWPFLGLLFEGVAALASGDAASRDRIFYEIVPYELFGESEFFDNGRFMGRVIILTKSARYVRIAREAVAEVARTHSNVLFALGEVCAQRGRFLADALTAQSTQPILARIASALLPFATPEQGLSAAIAPLPSLTQAQIAASAGTVKEVAARAIAELENRGLLKRERGHIKYLDRQRLLDLIRESV